MNKQNRKRQHFAQQQEEEENLNGSIVGEPELKMAAVDVEVETNPKPMLISGIIINQF
jgi:hypothetical protein